MLHKIIKLQHLPIFHIYINLFSMATSYDEGKREQFNCDY